MTRIIPRTVVLAAGDGVRTVGDRRVSVDIGHAKAWPVRTVLLQYASCGRQTSVALLHESSLARTMPTNRILTGRCDMILVGRSWSPD